MKRAVLDHPLVFAHRGACRVAPENTLPAFAAALAARADGIELDVRLTSDGVPVVCHNAVVENTSDGRGRLSRHTLAELRRLDFGRWFGPTFAGTRIPTLDEVLDLAAGRLLVNIELKSAGRPGGVGQIVIERVRAHGMADQVVISSFDPLALRSARQAGPEIEGGLLLAPDLPGLLRWDITRRWSRANALHARADMVNTEYVARANRLGLPVRSWTVNDPVEMRRLIDLGIDAIISDCPDVVAELLARREVER